MKIKLTTFGLILGIILVILNSCGENPQAVDIEEKPKDTIKTEEEIVLKIEELDSVYVEMSGVKAKYSLDESINSSNPSNKKSEYISEFNYKQFFMLEDYFTKTSTIDNIIYKSNYGQNSELRIVKNQENKLFNFYFLYYYFYNAQTYGYNEAITALELKNINLSKSDTIGYYFDIISPRIDTLIKNLSYNYTSMGNIRGPNGFSSLTTKKFISITEISDSAKISIRIYKKKK
jgi:hypothetical protein